MQRLSFGCGGGEVAEDVWRGAMGWNTRLLWKSAGDWEREPHGGQAGDGDVDTCVSRDVEVMSVENWVFWFISGDWHLDSHGRVWEGLTVKIWVFWDTAGDWLLDPHGGVWEGLDTGTEKPVENWVFWLDTGDWLLDPQGESGEVVLGVKEGLGVEKEATVEVLLFWLTVGDWPFAPQGGVRGECIFESSGDLKEGVEAVVDWMIAGEWHLDPQGGERGDVGVWEGLDVEMEVLEEHCIFGLVIK